MVTRSMLRQWSIVISVLWLGTVLPAHAQNTFQSGSTGADGAFAPTADQTIVLPESGVFNFTTITIPANVTITFGRNASNTPVTLLATGDVSIAGRINVTGSAGNPNGIGGVGGPGGFHGGSSGAGIDAFAGMTGDGPGGGGGGGNLDGTKVGGGGGGGFATAGSSGSNQDPLFGQGGPRYGTSLLLPLVGGAGGGGGGARTGQRGGAGGGGGGAILIASSTAITCAGSGNIRAGGGNGTAPPGGGRGGGGGGAGGAIRLVANTIAGAGKLDVSGGGGAEDGGRGGLGYLRAEAFNLSTYNPDAAPTIVTFAPPNPVVLPNAPKLRIASVAGMPAPTSPLGSFQNVPDIVLPASQSNAVDVVIEASNVPTGTVVQVKLIPATGAPSGGNSSPLTGSAAAASARASVTLPTGVSALFATATIPVTTASATPPIIKGEHVEQMEISASYGGASEVTYITQSGRRIQASDLSE